MCGRTYPCRKCDKEECPLLRVEHAQQFYRVLQLVHGRFERRETRGDVFAGRHVFVRC